MTLDIFGSFKGSWIKLSMCNFNINDSSTSPPSLQLTCKYGVVVFVVILVVVHVIVLILVHTGQVLVVGLIGHVLFVVLVVDDHRRHFSPVQRHALAATVQRRAGGGNMGDMFVGSEPNLSINAVGHAYGYTIWPWAKRMSLSTHPDSEVKNLVYKGSLALWHLFTVGKHYSR